MADVIRGERGQLFIVTAITLGVLFVALALLLNTAIFAENLATRSTDPGVKEAIDFREEVGANGDVVIRYANLHNRTTYTTIGNGFDKAVSGWSDALVEQSIHSGRGAVVSNVSVTFGGQIAQTNNSRAMTSGPGNADWELVDDADEFRSFNMTIYNESLAEGEIGDLDLVPEFQLTVEDGSTTWELSAFNDSTDGAPGVTISVTAGASTATCGPYHDRAELNLVLGTVNGSCSIPAFPGSPSGDYDVSISNGDNAIGTYRATLRQTESTLETGVYNDETLGESPFATVLIWKATYNVTYTGPDLYYGTVVQSAPEAGHE